MSALELLLKTADPINSLPTNNNSNSTSNQNNKHNYWPAIGAGVAALGLGGFALKKGLLNKIKPINSSSVEKGTVVKTPKIRSGDLDAHLKDVYSRHFPWDDSITVRSAYVASKKEFAKKLLDNIDNKEEFLKIYNSDYINPNLLNIELDKKYDEIEELYGVPLNLAVSFDKFNIKDGTLTERIKKLITAFYKDGVREVKNDIKYEVDSEDWDDVKDTLERILR